MQIPIVIPAGLTVLLTPRTKKSASNPKLLSKLYSLLPKTLLATIFLPAPPSNVTLNKFPPDVTGLRRQVSSLVVPTAKTISTTTALCLCALITTLNSLIFSHVTHSQLQLHSALTLAPATHRLATCQTKLNLCLATGLAKHLVTPSRRRYLPTVV